MNIILNIHGIFNLAGGAEKVVIELANEMHERGHTVSIVIIQKGVRASDPPCSPLRPGIRIYNLYTWISSEGFRPKEGKNDSVHVLKTTRSYMQYAKIKTRNILRRLIYSCAKTVNLEYQLWKVINNKKLCFLKKMSYELKPDVVVSFLASSYVLAVEALKGTGIPVIVSNRNDPALYLDGSIRYNNYGLIENAIRGAVANTVQLSSFKSFFPEDIQKKTHIIPNAVWSFPGQAYDNVNEKKNVIITVGRLHPQKNHQLLIRGFELIATKYPDWILKIFGDGELFNDLYKTINKKGLCDRVYLMGIKRDLHKEYLQSSFFVLPSLYEGFSNALAEAMACGLPSLVIEECISNAELVTRGDCGVMVKNNIIDFAKGLEFLIQNPAKRKEYGKNALKFVEQFQPKDIFDKWENLIIKVANKKETTNGLRT